MKVTFITASPALLMTGCLFFGSGDAAVNVTGKIPVGNFEPDYGECTLQMMSEKHGAIGYPKEVGSDISMRFLVFTIVGARARYYFVAQCQDGRSFRSREIILNGSKTHFDIGTLTEEAPVF